MVIGKFRKQTAALPDDVCACLRAYFCMYVCFADSLDEAILHVDVGMERLVVIDNAATFDQEPLALPRHIERKRLQLKISHHKSELA